MQIILYLYNDMKNNYLIDKYLPKLFEYNIDLKEYFESDLPWIKINDSIKYSEILLPHLFLRF